MIVRSDSSAFQNFAFISAALGIAFSS